MSRLGKGISPLVSLGKGSPAQRTHLYLELSLFLSLSLSLSLSPSLPPIVADTQYQYGKQLLELEACSLVRKEALPDYMCRVVTPLQLGEWQSVLSDYPDQEFVAYILRGTENGF